MATRDPLQIQARALGDPTRHAIFRFVADAERPLGVAELTERFGLHHNAVRQHLAKLVDADLVIEATAAPSGRGRPRLLYTLAPSTDSRWGVTGPYERLAVLLSEMVRTGDGPEAVGRRAGRQVRLGAAPDGTDPVEELGREMARQGFAPEIRRSDHRVAMVLTECPFVSAVMTDQSTICRLHLGLAQGAAEAIGGIEVERLVPHDPRRAHCLLDCRVTGTDETEEPDEPDGPDGPDASDAVSPAAAPGPGGPPPVPPSTADLRPRPDPEPGTALR